MIFGRAWRIRNRARRIRELCRLLIEAHESQLRHARQGLAAFAAVYGDSRLMMAIEDKLRPLSRRKVRRGYWADKNKTEVLCVWIEDGGKIKRGRQVENISYVEHLELLKQVCQEQHDSLTRLQAALAGGRT